MTKNKNVGRERVDSMLSPNHLKEKLKREFTPILQVSLMMKRMKHQAMLKTTKERLTKCSDRWLNPNRQVTQR